MEKYICIHGHFYQPPRENPWLETIELQDSAYPYHDWNARINAECYAPNASARVLDPQGRIDRLVNNYSKISFNIGPTLMAWINDHQPEIRAAIVEADKMSQGNFSGHGSALAQVYNHMILPLANRRDKITQVRWGIYDFEHWFNRKPEGMWLPETAADLETLDVLADQGIRFTVLSPYQASRVRRIGGRNWRDVNGGRIDPSMPYEVRLPSGRKIAVFFYDAPVSQAVAFERLLVSGEKFAHRLLSAFSDKRNWEQLVHIATDGESYGHHHRHGEMALAYALEYLESNRFGKLTNYGEFLEKHPPTHLAEIHEKSAWSCAHGVERWRSDCGCNSGMHSGWNQAWRAPLRESLDWLRDQLAGRFQTRAAERLKDPWRARDGYISVILDRSPESLERFFNEHAIKPLDPGERVEALKLLEMQRHAMLMFTSCGWFFDELSGIETVQVIQYAGRALQLAQQLFKEDFEPGFLEILSRAKSNLPMHGDGRQIFQKFVKPATVDWEHVAGHYAISSLFESYEPETRINAFRFTDEHRQVLTAGRARMALGRVKVQSEITQESALLTYGVLYLGEHNLNGGVRIYQGEPSYDEMVREMSEAFDRADFVEAIRLMDRHFGESSYSLQALFRDEQRKVVGQILDSTLADVEESYRRIWERYIGLSRFLEGLGVPLPKALQTTSSFVLNADLRRQFESDQPDIQRISELHAEIQRTRAVLDAETLAYSLKGTLERMLGHLASNPGEIEVLQRLTGLAGLLRDLPLDMNLWKAQNLYYGMLKSLWPGYHGRLATDAGDETARTWIEQFRKLGEHLGFRVET